jgi:hypothetical protein
MWEYLTWDGDDVSAGKGYKSRECGSDISSTTYRPLHMFHPQHLKKSIVADLKRENIL